MSTKTRPNPDLAAFQSAMSRLFEGLPGKVGVAVRELRPGGRSLDWNANETFPTASTLKIPLLYELYRQAESGRVDLDERITLRHADRVPGSGTLQHMDDGLTPTLRDLAELMIIVSDNWATDIIYGRLGKGAVAGTLASLGLNRTYLPMTIRELFATLVGADPADPELTYEALRDRLREQVPAADNPGMAFDARNDVSTPADMARLMTLIHAGHGLSDGSRDAIIDTLKHQNFTSIIPHRLPPERRIETAHKTGSLRGVKNDVGLVLAPGAAYAIALMSREQDDVPEIVDRLSHASRWVWDRLSTDAA